MHLLNITHHRQRHESDCLVACAAMMLDYLHIPIRYERLYKLLRAQPFGTAFRNINFLKSLGLSIVIEDGSVETLRQYLEVGLPVLISVDTADLPYWNRESTDHAIIVVGMDMDEKVVYIHDPFFADAPKKLAIDKFESAWLEKEYLCAVIGLETIDQGNAA